MKSDRVDGAGDLVSNEETSASNSQNKQAATLDQNTILTITPCDPNPTGALQEERCLADGATTSKNPPTFSQHEDLPSDLQDQLDLLGLHYWPECHGLLCRSCQSASQSRPTKTKLCRKAVLPHLQEHHNFNAQLLGRILERCLEKLDLLSWSEEGVSGPYPGLLPRSFLEAPVNGWACSLCNFATDDARVSDAHFKSRHATYEGTEKPPRRVLVQGVDGVYFEVKGGLIMETKDEETAEVTGLVIPEIVVDEVDALPDFLHHWVECHAIICKACENRPILSRNTVVNHTREYHPDGDSLRDLEVLEHNLNIVEPLAEEPEEIRLPNLWLGVQSFLQPPVAGYACSSSSCGWACENMEKMKEHHSKAHPAEIAPSKRTLVMVQFVTLLDRVFFPVGRFSDVVQDGPQVKIELETNDSSDFQKYLNSVKDTRGWNDEAEDISLWAPEDGASPGQGKIKVSSIADSNQTHRSIALDRGFLDTYSAKERYEILASLWNSPNAADLKPLSADEVRSEIRSLVLRDKDNTVNELKRFDTVFRQTLLATQHEIIELEEAMSQGTHVPTETLRKMLTEYASLVKSYQDLLVIKQPGQKESRAFGRLLATQLHEPRYWYAVDALDLIDLRIQVERGTHDVVRKFLQQRLPVSFLDRVGKERRELDEIEARKELPSGGMAKIIEAYRRHGRYISPSVDNFARILFALIGGIFLLVPMIAMAYITSKIYLLVTTVLFVLFFAIILALSSKASNQELVAATAAYAAVLVVFVGNNIGPGSGSASL